MPTTLNRRKVERRETDCAAELTWRTADGEKRWEPCHAVNLSDGGMAVECSEAIPQQAHVILRAPDCEVAALAQVSRCAWKSSVFVLGLRFIARTTTAHRQSAAPDDYELLRLAPTTDSATVERLYRTLMKRFHPDNRITGDAEICIRIAEAYRILGDPGKCGKYDAGRAETQVAVHFDVAAQELFAGVKGERNRRLAVLCLLYRKRLADPDRAGLSLLEIQQSSGFTSEELGFALWYVCEKGWVRLDNRTQYSITAEGVDAVENRLSDSHPSPKTVAAI